MDMRELAINIVKDVRSNNPNATPKDVVARLENLGFASEFAAELVANFSGVYNKSDRDNLDTLDLDNIQ